MDSLVWIDCEMTGLSLAQDALIEVAALVTDKNLNVLGDGVDVIIKPPAEALTGMDPFVVQMHTASGLLDLLDGGVTLAEAEAQVLAYIAAHVPEAGKVPLAGNTIGTDRAFLARDMPALEKYVHYRNVDVSTLKELAKRWVPRVVFFAPEKQGNHRALADIQESIEELRYYREALFVPEPGPDRGRLAAIAAKCRGSLTGLTASSSGR
jgi:oligoribonuclease